MGRRLGLFIGINQYQDSTFQPLRYAESDTTMLARWLGNERGGDWPSAEILTLTGAEATRERVGSLVTQLCLKAAQPGDLILIYFAGHAFIDEASGDGLLACANTSYRQPPSALHFASLVKQVIVPSRAAQVLVLLDCFQTGAAWNAQRTSLSDFRPFIGQSSLSALQQAEGRICYCSCRGNDLAPETGEQGCGSFVYRTIIGLSGPVRDAEAGQATLQQLHTYLSARLSPQHQPQAFGRNASPIVLVGAAPVYAGVAFSSYALSISAPTPSAAPPVSTPSTTTQAGQVTFQGVGESAPLLAPDTPRTNNTTGQLSSSTSGPISISQVEQNYQQQCLKLMQQARQQVAIQNLPEALQLVEQVLRMAPTYTDTLTLKAQILGTTGRFQEAIAATELLLQLEPGNALAWSMYAALLTNTGRIQEALTAINRALTLQPGNAEALAMRQSILSNLPAQQPAVPAATPAGQPARESATSFLIGAGVQLLAFILGLLGAAMQVYLPKLPNTIGFILESFGLAALCVLAARGSFRYGASRLLSTVLLCIAAAGILGGLYKFQYAALINKIVASPSLLVPVIFFAIWLIAAASLPLLTGLGGLVVRLVMGARRKP